MELSLDRLKRKLSQSTWLPLAIMALFYLISVVAVLQKQHRGQLESTKYAMSDLVFSQETAFAQEVFLNLEPAIELRIQGIVKDWAKKHPDMEVCVRMSLLHGLSKGKTLEGCSPKLEKRGLFQEGLSEERVIHVGEKTLASLRFSLIRPTLFLDLFPPLILTSLLLSLLIAFVSYQLLIRRIEKSVLTPLLEKLSQEERNSAVAHTTKMLAHDIRKPFSIVRLALDKLTSSHHPQVRSVGQEIAGEVVTSLDSVDSMLTDILDISRNMEPKLEEVSMGDLIDQALNTVTRIYPTAQITVTYELHHRHAIHADREQILRVLTNLIENAFQAMDGRGNLEISTSENFAGSQRILEVSLRNDGPLIPGSDRPRIFDAFVTGRKNGTGLGLAISKKIIESHKGSLTCVSNETSGTIFSFILLSNGRELGEDPRKLEMVEIGLRDTSPEKKSLDALRDQTILVFDDEAYVHRAWKKFSAGHPFLTFAHFSSWEDFVGHDAFNLAENAVAFVDLRYKNSKHDGMGIAKALRKLGARKIYAITSDRDAATASGLFDRVFGKEIPKEFNRLVG
jgi:signal transduction histidine kinase